MIFSFRYCRSLSCFTLFIIFHFYFAPNSIAQSDHSQENIQSENVLTEFFQHQGTMIDDASSHNELPAPQTTRESSIINVDNGNNLSSTSGIDESVTYPNNYLLLKRSERKLYVYINNTVYTSYTVAIGKSGWETPLGDFYIINKQRNPIWKNLRTGEIVPPSSSNPLGMAWIGFWENEKYQAGFHGTNQPELIGQAVSHGCVRMRNEDVLDLYKHIYIGMAVRIVD